MRVAVLKRKRFPLREEAGIACLRSRCEVGERCLGQRRTVDDKNDHRTALLEQSGGEERWTGPWTAGYAQGFAFPGQ